MVRGKFVRPRTDTYTTNFGRKRPIKEEVMGEEKQLDLFENHEQDGGGELKEQEDLSPEEQEKQREEGQEKREQDAIADPSNLQTPTELKGGAGETSLTGNSTPA